MIPERLRPRRTPEWSQVILLGAVGIRMAASLALIIAAGRLLTPAEFGGFALVATAFGLAHEFTDMGTSNVAVRASARAPDRETAVLENLLGLRLVLCGAAGLACATFAVTRTDGVLRGMLLAAGGAIACSYVSAFNTVFQLRQAQIYPAGLMVLTQVGALVAAALLLLAPVDRAWLGSVLVGREVAFIVGTTALATMLLGHSPRPRFSRDAFRPFLGVALVVAIATIAYHFQLQGGLFWVQVLRPEAETGAFAAAQRPLNAILFLPWIVMLPLVPLLSRLAAEDRPAFVRQGIAATDLLAGLGAVMAVVTFQVAAPLMAFLYGGRFSDGPLSAVAAVQWLAFPLGASFVVAATSTILLGDHREGALLAVSLAGCAVYAALNLHWLPMHGFLGSAMATAVATGLVAIGGVALGLPAGIRPGRRTVEILLPAAILYPLLGFLSGPPFLVLVMAAVLTAVALAAVWRFPGLASSRAEQVALSRDALVRDA